MQLVILCREVDLKIYSVNTVFERLVHDLKIMETDGIAVNRETLKGSLFCITGDNLGAHMVGGFQESFMANYFCRYCEVDRSQGLSLDKMGIWRTFDSYKCCVQM